MAATSRNQLNDTEAAELHLVSQIDNLQRISQQQKRDQLGDRWFKEVREFYNLFPLPDTGTPVFRPTVRIPEAQMLGLMEAIDLTDIDPRIYLVKEWDNYQQDENAEVCLQAFWRDAEVNLKILYAMLWSWFCGCGFLQVGHDPTKRMGLGDVTVHWRDPDSVFPDPYALNDADWQFLILEDYMWLDRVRELWPVPGQRVPLRRSADAQVDVSAQQRANINMGLEVPAISPMAQMLPGLPVSASPGDARVRVRTLFTRDASRIKVGDRKTQKPLKMAGLAEPEYIARYPRGRMVIESNGVILFDGDNPFLHGEFPVVRFLGMPALHGFWAPPPFRFLRTPQEIGERILTQGYENIVRLLNGVWFVDESTGIDVERFGGVPGEVQMKAMGSPTPELVQPKGTGGTEQQMADYLFGKNRVLAGFPEARLGKMPQGNASNDLFLGAISQTQTLTRGRGRLLYGPLRRTAYLIFATMAQYIRDNRRFADPRSDGFGMVGWEPVPIEKVKEYATHVDPASIQPYSAAMLRATVPLLRNLGMIDVETAHEFLRLPNRKKILERLNKEAIAKAQMGEMSKAGKKTR